QRLGSRIADRCRRTNLCRKDTEQQRFLAYPLVRGDPDPVFRSFVSAGIGRQADGEQPCPTCASVTSRRRTSISRSFGGLAYLSGRAKSSASSVRPVRERARYCAFSWGY